MANVLDTVITIVIGTLTGVVKAVTTTVNVLQDFFYVKIAGVSFIVLGSRQTGKTTLIEWLKHNMNALGEFNPDPTAAGGDVVPEFTTKVGDTYMKLKPNRDVGGEYAMWETDWVELFRGARPNGILFMLDQTDPFLQKDALNFVLQMIDDEPTAALMRLFYRNLWEQNMPPLEALRQAQLSLYRHPEQVTALASATRGPNFNKVVKLVEGGTVESSAPRSSPRRWAAFVLSGTGQ